MPPLPVHVPYDLPIEHRFVRPYDKSLTDLFLDKLMPSLEMLTKLEHTIPHFRRVEKMCEIHDIKSELTKFIILSRTLDPNLENLFPNIEEISKTTTNLSQ